MTEDPQKEIDRLNKKLTELSDDNQRLRSYLRTFQDDASKVGYLQLQILRLESQWADQQEIIEKYRRDKDEMDAKWGKFYSEYQQSHSIDTPTQV